MERIAIKKLTASDLSFFAPIFRRTGTSKQKAINLNADVFVDRFYPSLPPSGTEVPVRLLVQGPDSAPRERLARTITRTPGAKNWRLNGELVHNPEDQPARFDTLAVGDLAVMKFFGDSEPHTLELILIAASVPADRRLHVSLLTVFSGQAGSMIEVDAGRLGHVAASTPLSHPIWDVAQDPMTDAALEDEVQGGETVGKRLQRPGVVISPVRLSQAKARQQETGHIGEALAWKRIQELCEQGAYSEAEWTSQRNAVSAHDYSVREAASNQGVRIDAKSTSQDWSQPFHMSIAELRAASTGGRYDIWRLFHVASDRASLRIAEDIQTKAKEIVESISLPTGVSIDSVSIDPSCLEWSEVSEIEAVDEE